MNKEEFLKKLKELDKKRKDLIQNYLCHNTKFIIGTKFKDINNNKYVIYDFSYDEGNKQIFYYLDDISNRKVIMISEQAIYIYLSNNKWTQINNLNK